MPHRLQNPKWPPGGPKMADGDWKGVYLLVFGHSKQLSLNKFFDPSTPSMRKGRDGGKRAGGKNGKKQKRKRQMKIVATTSLPAVDRPNADRWNAARSRQNSMKGSGEGNRHVIFHKKKRRKNMGLILPNNQHTYFNT